MVLTTRVLALASGILLVATGARAERHYDCSKPGNANKAVCKAAAGGPASPSAPPTAASSPRRYDCSKPGNANKAVCKAAPGAPAVASTTPAPTTAPRPSPAPTPQPTAPQPRPAVTAGPPPASTSPRPATASYKGRSITADPAGATGQCKDGSYTHATHHSGACSRHGGVARWMS